MLWYHSSSRMCFGFSSSILLMKSPFSKQPSQVSSQSFKIFLRSRTLSFLRSIVFKSICFSIRKKIQWYYRVLPPLLWIRYYLLYEIKKENYCYHIVARKLACPFSLIFRRLFLVVLPRITASTFHQVYQLQHLRYRQESNKIGFLSIWRSCTIFWSLFRSHFYLTSLLCSEYRRTELIH